MSKKIVYIAHPIGGKVDANIADLSRILRKINISEDYKDYIPLAPYFGDVMSLDDSDSLERKRGIDNGIEVLKSGIFKELWLTGEYISPGMHNEVREAILNGIKVVDLTNKL